MTTKVDERFTLKDVLLHTRVVDAMGKQISDAGKVTTLADLEPYFAEERNKAMIRCELADRVYDLFVKMEPFVVKSRTGERPKLREVKEARREHERALRRRASCVADTMLRAEEADKREQEVKNIDPFKMQWAAPRAQPLASAALSSLEKVRQAILRDHKGDDHSECGHERGHCEHSHAYEVVCEQMGIA